MLILLHVSFQQYIYNTHVRSQTESPPNMLQKCFVVIKIFKQLFHHPLIQNTKPI